MQDVQFISELMAVSLLREVNGFDHDWLNELYAKYEDSDSFDPDFDPGLFTESFNVLASYLSEVEDQTHAISRFASNFAHLYSLWGWLALRDSVPAINDLSAVYSGFMTSVAAAIAGTVQPGTAAEVLIYAENSRGASTDLKQRMERHKALSTVLDAALAL